MRVRERAFPHIGGATTETKDLHNVLNQQTTRHDEVWPPQKPMQFHTLILHQTYTVVRGTNLCRSSTQPKHQMNRSTSHLFVSARTENQASRRPVVSTSVDIILRFGVRSGSRVRTSSVLPKGNVTFVRLRPFTYS